MNQNRTLPLFLLCCLLSISLVAQKSNSPIANQIKANLAFFEIIAPTELLTEVPNQNLKSLQLDREVSKANFFTINQEKVSQILASPTDFLKLNIPNVSGKDFELELYQANVFTPEFQVYVASNRSEPYPYEKGAYYWGIVKGQENSMAAIAVNQGEVMGFVSVDGHTYTLGKMPNSALTIFYKEEDLMIQPTAECGTDDVLHDMGKESDLNVSYEKDANNCVKMYVEVDYDIVQGKGGVTAATDYVTAVFSQVAILYAQEEINFSLNELVVWDVNDPYSGSSTSNYLTQFRDNLGGIYNGDLAHLVGYSGGGGIAYVNVLCNSFYGVGYSAINSSYNNVPTYSWSVEVLTHEIGHNLGSPHTHSCSWGPNGNEPVDCCGANAGYPDSNCSSCNIPNPSEGGTIMSYCHLTSVGIDFMNGFGTQPGDLVRSRVYNASCLSSCSAPAANDAGISSIAAPSGTVCATSATPVVVLSNYGTSTLSSVTIQYQLDGGGISNYNWAGSLASGASTSVTLPSVTFGAGGHSFNANTTNPNGASDENAANDGSNTTFTSSSQSTYYEDADGDGYGNPNSTVVDCSAPTGYVADNTDCNDTDSNAYPGASCSDGDVCTEGDVLDNNCNCVPGSVTDSDGDGVCDAEDVCPGGDDGIDSDGNGTPDFCDCSPATANFNPNPLTHSGAGSSSVTINFAAGSKNPSFSVSGINSKINGNPNGRYIDRVTVSYVDASGSNQVYGTYNGNSTSSANVNISGGVQSVTVSLTDAYDGNASANMSVNMSAVDYCGDGVSCTDSDGDGVCDADDVCPGGDDTIDSDGDGIPDDCDTSACPNTVTSNFDTSPLTHVGGGSANSMLMFTGEHTDVEFTISNLNARLNGKASRRYNEQVAVSYVNGAGASVSYGTFLGSQVSAVDVSIAGVVQSISINLSDAYDGNSSTNMSVNISPATSCQTTGGMVQGGLQEAQNNDVLNISMHPNPAREELFIDLGQSITQAKVVLYNLFGSPQAEFEVTDQRHLRIDLNRLQIADQILLVSIQIPTKEPITKRLILLKR